MLTSEPIAAPSSLPISASASIARASPARARSTSIGRVGTRPVELGGGTIGREPRRVRLEMPAPVAVPLARLAAGDDDDVPELGPAAIETVVDDEAAADARAEREHDQVRRAPPRPEPPLGERRGVAVVLDAGRQPVALAGAVREVHLVEREVHRAQRDAGAAIDVERDAVADRGRAVREQVLDDAVDRAQHLLLGSVGRRRSRSCGRSCRRARRGRRGSSSRRGRPR